VFGSSGRDRVDGPSPPYLLTALALLGSMAVSQAIPWAKRAIAGDVPPLLAQLHPSVGPWLPLAIVAVVAALLILPRSLAWPTWRFLVGAVVMGFAVAVALAVEAHGLSALTAPFRRPLEYFASVPLADTLGPRAFAAQFPDLGSRLSLHAATHGPSAVLFLWLLWKLTGESLLGVSLLVALIGLAGVIPTYLIARAFGQERAARLAALLFLCAPGVLIYSATSMDAVFMTVIAGALAALVRFPRSSAWAVAAGILWAIALSFTFGALVLGLFALGIGIVALRDRTEASAPVVTRAVLVLAGLVLGCLLLRAALGMNLIAGFRAAVRANNHNPSRARPYLYWVFANLPAFLWVAGIAQTALFVHETRSRWRTRTFGFETVFVGTLVLSSLSGVFLGEVDHIWLFFIPPLTVVAGSALARILRSAELQTDVVPLPRVLAVSLAQATLIQVLLYTYW
jgi:hypothetical protein